MTDKLPWFKWYANDWLSDEKLRACSLAARGLWADMLSLMHKGDRRGYLQLSGKPITPQQLARLTNCSVEEASQALAELFNAGVPSATEDGIVYSRRIVRDENKRQKCSDAGFRGGGNPTFKGPPKGGGKGGSKRTAKHPSDSDISVSASSFSSEEKEGVEGEKENGFARFWRLYPRKVAKREAAKAWGRLAPGPELLETMLGALEAQKQSEAWRKSDGEYIPHPSTWLKGRRWEDEIDSARPNPVLNGLTAWAENNGVFDEGEKSDQNRICNDDGLSGDGERLQDG